jgi:hypothetical protein
MKIREIAGSPLPVDCGIVIIPVSMNRFRRSKTGRTHQDGMRKIMDIGTKIAARVGQDRFSQKTASFLTFLKS